MCYYSFASRLNAQIAQSKTLESNYSAEIQWITGLMHQENILRILKFDTKKKKCITIPDYPKRQIVVLNI